MKIYHNPRCAKSREALSILQDNGIDPEIILYLQDPLRKEDLQAILKKLKIPAEALIRKTESVYKEQFKSKKMTESQWINVMVKHPKLIERPIITKGKTALIGRPPSLVLDII